MQRRTVVAAIACVTLAGLTTACGSSGGNSGGNGGSSGGSSGGGGGRGPITYVQGKDNNNLLPTIAQMWNSQHPNEQVTIKQQSDQADDQHQDLVQHFQAKDPGYDVVSVDVIWTAEFAAKGWLTPLKGANALDTSNLLPAPVKAATYNGTLYAGPSTTDGGLLYYRKDLVPNPPATWADMIKDCDIAKQHNMICYGGQFAQYEGLTVNASEAINTAGGSIVGEDGKTPAIPSPQATNGLNFLVNGFQQGYISKDELTWQEEQGRQAFEAGKVLFLRNWPYMYSLATTDSTSVVKDKFGVAPLPGDSTDPGGKTPGVSTLGGHNIAISQFSQHKATALDFIKFIESQPVQTVEVEKASVAPVIASLYTDQTLVSKFPYLPTLLKSVQSAQPRPVSPFYPAITQAIEQNVYTMLQGQKSVQQAQQDIAAAIKSASGG